MQLIETKKVIEKIRIQVKKVLVNMENTAKTVKLQPAKILLSLQI